MKPEYDEAAEILNKGEDVSLLSCPPAAPTQVDDAWCSSRTILPLRLRRLLAARSVLLAACLCLAGRSPVSLSSRSLAVPSAAVIQHSQAGRRAAHESTPAWWLWQLSHPSDLEPFPGGSMPAAGGQWEEPGHYRVWMDWSLYYRQPLKPSMSFIFRLHIEFAESRLGFHWRAWISTEVEGLRH